MLVMKDWQSDPKERSDDLQKDWTALQRESEVWRYTRASGASEQLPDSLRLYLRKESDSRRSSFSPLVAKVPIRASRQRPRRYEPQTSILGPGNKVLGSSPQLTFMVYVRLLAFEVYNTAGNFESRLTCAESMTATSDE
jgi:hypothetical protein